MTYADLIREIAQTYSLDEADAKKIFEKIRTLIKEKEAVSAKKASPIKKIEAKKTSAKKKKEKTSDRIYIPLGKVASPRRHSGEAKRTTVKKKASAGKRAPSRTKGAKK